VTTLTHRLVSRGPREGFRTSELRSWAGAIAFPAPQSRLSRVSDSVGYLCRIAASRRRAVQSRGTSIVMMEAAEHRTGDHLASQRCWAGTAEVTARKGVELSLHLSPGTPAWKRDPKDAGNRSRIARPFSGRPEAHDERN
jgi:hypothetical protein